MKARRGLGLKLAEVQTEGCEVQGCRAAARALGVAAVHGAGGTHHCQLGPLGEAPAPTNTSPHPALQDLKTLLD